MVGLKLNHVSESGSWNQTRDMSITKFKLGVGDDNCLQFNPGAPFTDTIQLESD